jgi:hypothetical protein
MADNYGKLWLQGSINANATNRALEAIQATGRALPCRVTAVSGSIVTVAFEVTGTWTLPHLELPKAESQWLRAPTQVGDFGLTMPADTFLGAVSGIGSGTADLGVDYGNLSTLVFVPIASTNFPSAPDPKKAWIYGPNGAVLSDAAQTVSVVPDHDAGTVTVTAGSFSFVVAKANGGSLQIGGSGTASGDAIMRASDVQAALNAFATTLQTWAAANFQHGASTPPAPTAPTATGSAKSFTA